MRQPVASFFCRVGDRTLLDRVEFYAQDLRILRELGYRIDIATSPRELRAADLFFGWWWTWGFVPALYARMRRRPMILTGVFDEWAYPGRSAPQRLLQRVSLVAPSANVFVSRFEYETVPRAFSVTRPEYCPLTVDVTTYAPRGTRGQFLLCVAGSGMHGGNSKRKCIEELIRAFGRVATTHAGVELVIVGRKGTDHPWLERVANEVGAANRVRFTGVISAAEKIELLQQCAIYLQPSRFEGFGLSILEAMACGACIVSSPVGAVPELLGDTGVMVDGTSPTEIAQRVRSLLDDPGERARLGERARARAVQLFQFGRRRDFMAELIDSLRSAPERAAHGDA